jgi:hypothetical protein
VGADRETGVDEYEFMRRRLTAAAYGFASWTEFRAWRKRNPIEYRERSRRLLEFTGDEREPGIVIDFVAGARRSRDQSEVHDPSGD